MSQFTYQEDSFARILTAKILSIEPFVKGDNSLIALSLSDSVFFPEGGGQPSDSGTLNDIPIAGLVKEPSYAVLIASKYSNSFSVNDEVALKLDWPKRWDAMQQHTGQHLLSALAVAEYEAKTVGWSFGEEKCTVDLSCKDISVQELETKVNTVIEEGRNISVSWHDLNCESPIERRLDKKPIAGPLRLITINSYPANPCCGTHLSNTSALSACKIIATERLKGGSIQRLSFVFGSKRITALLEDKLEKERLLNVLLKTSNHTSMVEKIIQDKEYLHSQNELYFKHIINSLDKSATNLLYFTNGTNDMMRYIAKQSLGSWFAAAKNTGSFAFAGLEGKDELMEILKAKGNTANNVTQGKFGNVFNIENVVSFLKSKNYQNIKQIIL